MNCFDQALSSVTRLRLLAAVIMCLNLCAVPLAYEAHGLPPEWARKIETPHLSNFYKVSEDLYRSAQPSADGFRELERMGIKTVINLRSLHSDEAALKDTTLRSEGIEMIAAFPSDDQVVQFLRIISKKENGPFLVHCQHGADRTGTMTAIYRIVVQGWSKDAAIAEMTQGGFGFHKIWNMTLVPYLRDTDLKVLKEEAGLE